MPAAYVRREDCKHFTISEINCPRFWDCIFRNRSCWGRWKRCSFSNDTVVADHAMNYGLNIFGMWCEVGIGCDGRMGREWINVVCICLLLSVVKTPIRIIELILGQLPVSLIENLLDPKALYRKSSQSLPLEIRALWLHCTVSFLISAPCLTEIDDEYQTYTSRCFKNPDQQNEIASNYSILSK